MNANHANHPRQSEVLMILLMNCGILMNLLPLLLQLELQLHSNKIVNQCILDLPQQIHPVSTLIDINLVSRYLHIKIKIDVQLFALC